MSVGLVTLLIFLSIAAAGLAVGLLLRDLQAPAEAPAAPVRRPLTIADAAPPQSGRERLDQGFERLIQESGLAIGSQTAALIVVFTGLLVGGGIFAGFGQPLVAVLCGMLGMGAALLYFGIRRARRMRQLQDQLPEVVDLLARAVHAGETLEQAVHLVGKEVSGALGDEFRWCSRQLDLGVSVASTMKSLAGRIRLLDIRLLTTILTVHRQTGGNLATALERLSGVIRSRSNFRRQMRAATGAGRFSAQMIAGAGPLLFLVLFFTQPDHVDRFFADSLGRSLLTMAIVLELVGIFWIRSLMKIDT